MWINDALAQLAHRKLMQQTPFVTIASLNANLTQRNATLEVKNVALHDQIELFDRLSRSDTNDSNQTYNRPARRLSSSSPEVLLEKLQSVQKELRGYIERESILKNEKTEVIESNKELERKLSSLNTELSETKKQFGAAQHQVDRLQKLLSEREDRIDTLQSELNASREACQHAEEKFNAVQQDNEDLIQRIVREKTAEADELNKMNVTIQELQTELNSAQKRIQQLTRDKSKSAGSQSEVTDDFVDLSFVVSSPGHKSTTRSEQLLQTPLPRSHAITIRGHSADINCLRFSSSSSTVASASSDGTIGLWDSVTGRRRAVLRGNISGGAGAMMSVDLCRSLVTSGCNDRQVRIWDTNAAKLTYSLTGHTGKVFASVFPETGDGRTVITASADRAIKIWDLSGGGKCVRTISTNSIINSMDISRDGIFATTAHQDGAVRVWELRNGAMIAENKSLHRAALTHASFVRATCDKHILTMSRDNTLGILTADTLELPRISDGHEGSTSSHAQMRFTHPNFRTHVNWAQAACTQSLGLVSTPEHEVNPLQRVDLPAYIAAGGVDGNVYIWDPVANRANAYTEGAACDDSSPLAKTHSRRKYDLACVLSGDGQSQWNFDNPKTSNAQHAAFASQLKMGSQKSNKASPIVATDWSPDGTVLALGAVSGVITLWKA